MDRRWLRWCSAGRRPAVVASRLLQHGLSALQQARGFSDHQAGTNGSSHDRQLLLREFLHFSLYDREQGYFTTRGAQSVGRLSEPIRFHTLLGREGYNYRLQQLYRELEVAWLTPVDIFQPWYGEALARHIVQRYGRLPVRLPSGRGGEGTPLRVMEVGGGTGTLAANVLGYLREKNPRLYRHIRYTALEISPQLAQMQRERLRREGHGAVHSVREGSALELATWGPCDDTPCFVLMTEVLDNLPHDRAVKLPEGTWHETVVHRPSAGGSSWRQHTRPLQDRLVQTVLEHQQQLAPPAGDALAGPHSRSWMDAVLDFAAGVPAPSQPAAAAGEDMNEVFLPTACMQLLTTLMMARPRHHLVAADFFQLPDVRIHGHGAPLVADTRPSGGRDFDTYLLPPGSADIFFPTNFDLLSRLYAGAAAGAGLGRSCFAEHRGTAQFMHEYADTFRTQTATSYNPLLEDFTNTRIFVGSTL